MQQRMLALWLQAEPHLLQQRLLRLQRLPLCGLKGQTQRYQQRLRLQPFIRGLQLGAQQATARMEQTDQRHAAATLGQGDPIGAQRQHPPKAVARRPVFRSGRDRHGGRPGHRHRRAGRGDKRAIRLRCRGRVCRQQTLIQFALTATENITGRHTWCGHMRRPGR